MDDDFRAAHDVHARELRIQNLLRRNHCELADFGIVERDVRKHPSVEEALLINVAFENRATFNQPYPLFEVRFTDSSGAPVAMRRFAPAL